ncbi:hypothetical protein [Gallibacterium anatis]|uniref:Uncharacterized protein n=1 Tax=Gallibacterium anatis 4895 TaxID=1396510 RepID=A0A0A2ZLJ5_9PAST|nr:hypothetical protein [Gallibacterium anatis]KGQ57948.1 hypothetical protein IO48_12860 [Gallibacterium anatis 4895]
MKFTPHKSDRYLKMHALALLPILNGLTPDEVQRLFRLIEQQYLFQHLETILPHCEQFYVDNETHNALILQWGQEFKQHHTAAEEWESQWLPISAPTNTEEAEALINLIQRKSVVKVS